MTKLSIETEIAIRRLVDQYCDGVIRRDGSIWGATWSDDAHWNLGMGREVLGKKAIVELWTTAMGAFNWTIQTAEHFSLNIDEAKGTGRVMWSFGSAMSVPMANAAIFLPNT